MTYLEIANMISEIKPDGSTSIPFSYRAFDESEAVAPPFICYLYTGNVPEPADNLNYVRIEELAIELYTDSKDFALEAKVEAVLDSHEMVYSKEETWLDDEKMQMTTYMMQTEVQRYGSTE